MILFGFFLKPPILTVVPTWPLPDAWLRQCPSFFSVAMIKTSRHEMADGKKVLIWLRSQVTVHHFGKVEAGTQNIMPIMKSRGMGGVWISAVCLCSARSYYSHTIQALKRLLTTDTPQAKLALDHSQPSWPSQTVLVVSRRTYKPLTINHTLILDYCRSLTSLGK